MSGSADVKVVEAVDSTMREAERVAYNPLPIDSTKSGLMDSVFAAAFNRGAPSIKSGFAKGFATWQQGYQRDTNDKFKGQASKLKHEEIKDLVARVQALSVETVAARDLDASTTTAIDDVLKAMSPQLQQASQQGAAAAAPSAAATAARLQQQRLLAQIADENKRLDEQLGQLLDAATQPVASASAAAAGAGAGAAPLEVKGGSGPPTGAAAAGTGVLSMDLSGTTGVLFGADLETMPIPASVRLALDTGLGSAKRSMQLATTAASAAAAAGRHMPIVDPELEILDDTIALMRSERRSPDLLSAAVRKMHEDGVPISTMLSAVWNLCRGRAQRELDEEFGREVARVDLLPALEFYAFHRHLRSTRSRRDIAPASTKGEAWGLHVDQAQTEDTTEFYAHLLLVVVATACLVSGWPMREGVSEEQLSVTPVSREEHAVRRQRKACMLLVCLKTEPYAIGVMQSFLTDTDVDVVVALAHRPLHWLGKRAYELLGRRISGVEDLIVPEAMRAFVDSMLACETLCQAVYINKLQSPIDKWQAYNALYVHFTENLYADSSAVAALQERQEKLEAEVTAIV